MNIGQAMRVWFGAALAIVVVGSGCDRPANSTVKTRGPNTEPSEHRPSVVGSRIVLDGHLDDWEGIESAIIDPVDAPEAELDLGAIAVVSDDRYLYLSLELRRELNVQRLDGTLELVFDADGSPSSGATIHGLEGADIVVRFSPPHRTRPEARHMGVGLYSPTHPEDDLDDETWLNIYDTGFFFAPTFASNVIECRLDRGAELADTAPLFAESSTRFKLALFDRDGVLRDDTAIVEHQFTHLAAGSAAPRAGEADALARTTDVLRVMSWNVQRGAMLTNAAPFRRIVRAVNPDVILFQEIPDDVTPRVLKSVLPPSNSEHETIEWHVVIGVGGGDLRTAIASRIKFTPTGPLRVVAHENRPNRTVRTMDVVVEFQEQSILLTSLHLKCCGRIDSSEDETRTTELILIGRAINQALEDQSIHGVVVGGDFNLVGGFEPMAVFQSVVSRELHLLNPMRLDGHSNVTWADPSEPFVPGRLDFLLASQDSLTEAGSFVFDSKDLSFGELQRLGLESNDAAEISDHRPVVVDLRWVDRIPAEPQNE